MNENIDLTKILKDCPTGWEFYSSIYVNVTFVGIGKKSNLPIKFFLYGKDNLERYCRVTAQGLESPLFDGECTLFPSKTQRDWSKFTAPWYKKDIEHKFQVGQYITDGYVGGQITSIEDDNHCYKIMGAINTYIPFTLQDNYHIWTIQDAKDGDVIHFGTVTAIFKKYICREKCICYCSFCKDGGFEIPIENGEDNVYGCYNATPTTKEQYNELMKAMHDGLYEWDTEKKELKKFAPNRFNPKTLKPFDRVIVRNNNGEWECAIFSHIKYYGSGCQYDCCYMIYRYCIPYNEDTKHLVGTTEEAPEYYRYWDD